MGKVVDYYFSPVSPWTYMGHERFVAMAKKHGATIKVKPMDLGKIFPLSGGLPLKQRAPQRQVYRMMELRRWQTFLQIPMTLEPKFFPAPADNASVLICAANRAQGSERALQLSFAFLRACWKEERNLGDDATLDQIAREQGFDLAALRAAQADARADYDRFTQEAVDRGVFGAPSFVIESEIFWGQDRLDFVERKLSGQ
jgi:2-hydroxychromene-2-carboxylate isomerase